MLDTKLKKKYHNNTISLYEKNIYDAVQQFIQNMATDGARPNLFRINFTGLALNGGGGTRNFSLKTSSHLIR